MAKISLYPAEGRSGMPEVVFCDGLLSLNVEAGQGPETTANTGQS